MLLLILIIVIALVAWALRLMEQAVKGQEFSLMLAGFLVASSAAALMGVYFLMGNYMLYMDHAAQQMATMEALDIPYSTYASATLPESANMLNDWFVSQTSSSLLRVVGTLKSRRRTQILGGF